MFHVSRLKGYTGDTTLPILTIPPGTNLNDNRTRPSALLNSKPDKLTGDTLVLTQWEGCPVEDTTWESLPVLQNTYPDLHLEDKAFLQPEGNDTNGA